MDSLEYQTLEKCYPILVSTIEQSPRDLVDYLIPLSILAPTDKSYVKNLTYSDADKARKIVDVVLSQVKTNPEVYYGFIKAMKASGDWTKNAVRELEMQAPQLSSADAKQCLPEDDSSKNLINTHQLLVLLGYTVGL